MWELHLIGQDVRLCHRTRREQRGCRANMGRRSVLADVLVYKFSNNRDFGHRNVGLPSLCSLAFCSGWSTIVVLCSVCSLQDGCSNPGVLKRHAEPPEGETGWRWSEQSQSYYPPGATYCRESQVIVHGYDHFCPWTGTTIAGGNMKYFTMFVSSLSFLCFYVIFLTVIGGAATSMVVSRSPASS